MRLSLTFSSLLPFALPMAAISQTVRKAEPVPEEVLRKGDSAGRQRAHGAISSAGTSVRKDPYDPRVVAAKAAALCNAGRAREAVDYLMDLKGQYLDFFPHQLALADSFAAARMFQDAAIAYDVVIRDPGYSLAERVAAQERNLIAGGHAARTNDGRPLTTLKSDTRQPEVHTQRPAVPTEEHRFAEARALLDRIAAARVRPTVQYDVRGTSQHEGSLWTSGIELSTGAFGDGRNIVFLRGIWDEIGLGHPRLISQEDSDRYQAEVAWRRLTRRGFYGEVTAGGSDQSGVFGAAVGRYDRPGPGWELRFRSNERATDSLLLMALGGVQDSVSLNYRHQISERWIVDARLGWRRVQIEGDDIADGVDLDFRLVYTLLEEADGRPGVTLGYFAEVQHLNRHRLPNRVFADVVRYARRQHDPVDALIDDRINRHGLVVTASKQFGARWTGFVYGGVAYEFEDHRTEGLAGAGLTAYLDRNTTLIISLDYSTSGNAANKGDDVITGMVKVRVSF